MEALKGSELDTASWINDLKEMKKNFPLSYDQKNDGPLKVPYVLEQLQNLTEEWTAADFQIKTVTTS